MATQAIQKRRLKLQRRSMPEAMEAFISDLMQPWKHGSKNAKVFMSAATDWDNNPNKKTLNKISL